MKRMKDVLNNDEQRFTVMEFDRLIDEYQIPKRPKNDKEKLELFLTLVTHANICQITHAQERDILQWVFNPHTRLRRLFDPTYDAYPREAVIGLVMIIGILCGSNLLLIYLLWIRFW